MFKYISSSHPIEPFVEWSTLARAPSRRWQIQQTLHHVLVTSVLLWLGRLLIYIQLLQNCTTFWSCQSTNSNGVQTHLASKTKCWSYMSNFDWGAIYIQPLSKLRKNHMLVILLDQFNWGPATSCHYQHCTMCWSICAPSAFSHCKKTWNIAPRVGAERF